MRENDILHNKTKKIKYSLFLLITCTISNIILPVNNMNYVQAQNQNIQYEYDPSGRLTIVRYPDGTEIKYQYDINGNIVSSEKVSGQILPDKEKQPGSNQPGSSQDADKQPNNNSAGNVNTGQDLKKETSGALDDMHYSAEDIKNYNKFKKSKPIIKSLKYNKNKKKHYLNIRIKQINKKGIYGEVGYQIKYATNSKFKKAKTLKITRKKKGSITSNKWKVKKGKTYYVKARAYMKTKAGKTIYSKYSKVKKIKTKR